MHLWRAPRVLLLVGGVLFLSGHALFASSFFQGNAGDVLTIPPGPEWAYVYEIKVLGAGRVFGQFADSAGGLVRLYVFEESEYRVFAFDGSGRSLYAARGPSGSFSASLPGSGTYYLVLAHGEGSEYFDQAVSVSYRVAGIQPDLIGVGVPFIAVGIAAVGIGLWQRSRASPAKTAGA